MCYQNVKEAADWLEYIKTFGPVIIGLAGIIFGYLLNIKTLRKSQIEDERKEIYSKLNEFYGPFQQLNQKNFMLYGLFRVGKDENFRTLTALLEGKKFEGNDKQLLEQIILNDKELEKLIISKSGLVDDGELREILAKATTHFNVISLAYTGNLKHEPLRFSGYVYPRELEGKIEEQIVKLKKRLVEINKI